MPNRKELLSSEPQPINPLKCDNYAIQKLHNSLSDVFPSESFIVFSLNANVLVGSLTSVYRPVSPTY